MEFYAVNSAPVSPTALFMNSAAGLGEPEAGRGRAAGRGYRVADAGGRRGRHGRRAAGAAGAAGYKLPLSPFRTLAARTRRPFSHLSLPLTRSRVPPRSSSQIHPMPNSRRMWFGRAPQPPSPREISSAAPTHRSRGTVTRGSLSTTEICSQTMKSLMERRICGPGL